MSEKKKTPQNIADLDDEQIKEFKDALVEILQAPWPEDVKNIIERLEEMNNNEEFHKNLKRKIVKHHAK